VKENRAALIVAGGAGTRLWPLSTDENPKQFLQIFGGRSLLQATWHRLTAVVPSHAIYVSTNERYRSLCLQQLPELEPSKILTEPARRNTGPAIAVSCYEIERRSGSTVTIGSFHSDQFVAHEDRFAEIVGHAYRFAADHRVIMTVGITPTEPATAFGYLELGEELEPGIIALRRFVEKPVLATAEEFLRAGNYAWNAGMFIWRADTFREALATHAPEISRYADDFVAGHPAAYDAMPAISIDYAVLEKAGNVAAVRGDLGWSDVGSWTSVAELIEGERTNVHTAEAENPFVLTASGKRVAIVGIDNVVVVDSPQGLLILNREKSQLLGDVVRGMMSPEAKPTS
jgi:mannose-1-phosphate guanylyltransferase